MQVWPHGGRSALPAVPFRLLQLPYPEADELGRPMWSCTSSDVAKAYRKLSILVHPDKVQGEGARPAAAHPTVGPRCLGSGAQEEGCPTQGPPTPAPNAGEEARQAFEHLNQVYRMMRDPGKLVGESAVLCPRRPRASRQRQPWPCCSGAQPRSPAP